MIVLPNGPSVACKAFSAGDMLLLVALLVPNSCADVAARVSSALNRFA
jgi:hypothetical protein